MTRPEIVVCDPNQLRSPSTAFDPAEKLSPKLLAGIGVSDINIDPAGVSEHDKWLHEE